MTLSIPRTQCGSSVARCGGSNDRLRAAGLDGYGGGILLFVLLAGLWLPAFAGIIALALAISTTAAWLVHVLLAYSLLALGDLLHHVWRIESAVRRRRHRSGAPARSARLVGRDTDRMDGPACRRAAVESLSENLTDGFVSPVFWYVLGGVPGLVLFKIVSTMDSMVGYKTPQYLRFGWCGARLDDVMNYLPARLTWFLIVCVAPYRTGLVGPKGLAGRLGAARGTAGTELRLERGGDCRSAGAANRWTDLAQGRPGDGPVGR